MTEIWCGHCGAGPDAPHVRCAQLLAWEPPRYCATCRRRMKVQVTPTGWSATCVEHGTRTHPRQPPPRPVFADFAPESDAPPG